MKLTKNKEIHIDFEFLKKRRNDIIFMILGIGGAAVVLYFSISSVSFLVSRVGEATGLDEDPTAATRFDLEGFQKLNIASPAPATPAQSVTPSDSPKPSASPTQEVFLAPGV